MKLTTYSPLRYQYSPHRNRGSSFVEATVIIGLVAVLVSGILSPSLKIFDSSITSDSQLLPVMTIRAAALFDDGTAQFNHSELALERARIRSNLNAEGFTTPACIHTYNIRRTAANCSITLDSEDPTCIGDVNKATCERLLQAAGCSDYVYGCFTSTSGASAVVRLLQPEFHLAPQPGPIDPTTVSIENQTPTPTPSPTAEPTPRPTTTPFALPPSPTPTATPQPTGTLPEFSNEAQLPQPELDPDEETNSETLAPSPDLTSESPISREHPSHHAHGAF